METCRLFATTGLYMKVIEAFAERYHNLVPGCLIRSASSVWARKRRSRHCSLGGLVANSVYVESSKGL